MNPVEQYEKKRLTPEQVVSEIAGLRNVILGMGVAMPPGLIRVLAAGLKDGRLQPIDLYYMHGTDVLQQNLLQPEMRDLVCPRTDLGAGNLPKVMSADGTQQPVSGPPIYGCCQG